MADYKRQYDEGPREVPERSADEARAWFRDDGTYRTDDRDYHERYRHDHDRPRADRPDAANDYYRAPRDQQPPEMARPDFKGRGPKGYQRADDRMCDEICDRTTDDSVLDASEITVEVKQGEVLLTGSVMSRDQKRRAEDVAERVSGVRDVANQLRVTRDGIGHNWASDSSRVSGPATTASSQPVTQASGKGTPSKSTASTTA